MLRTALDKEKPGRRANAEPGSHLDNSIIKDFDNELSTLRC